MTELTINGRSYDIDLIAFDKDGTLVDFDHMWGQKFRAWLDLLLHHANAADDTHLRHNLEQTLGLDTENNAVLPESPFAVATLSKISVVAMTVLYQHGRTWHEAEAIVKQTVDAADYAMTADLVKPIGAVQETIQNLKAQGVKIAIVTSDDRDITEQTLPLLGIDQDVDILVCGDDPFPNKPAPDGLLHISREFDIPTNKMIMVGDTASDMVFGRNAGVAVCIGIHGGGGNPSEHADLVVSAISEIW